MSVSSPCEICQSAAVRHACDRCGKLVCQRHFDDELGLCVQCAADVTGDRPRPGPGQGNPPDGVDTYRF